MRTILIDLIDTQGTFKGSGVYIRKVFLTLLKTVEDRPEYAAVHFVCTYDFNRPILYPDFSVESLSANPRVTVVDIAKTAFPEVCRQTEHSCSNAEQDCSFDLMKDYYFAFFAS